MLDILICRQRSKYINKLSLFCYILKSTFYRLKAKQKKHKEEDEKEKNKGPLLFLYNKKLGPINSWGSPTKTYYIGPIYFGFCSAHYYHFQILNLIGLWLQF